MKLTYAAITTVLAMTIALPVFGQKPPDRFVDVPKDHWAYQAVESLRQRGILIGYPDGHYRGSRTLTRYEMAAGVDRALQSVKPGPQGPKGEKGARGETGPQGPRGSQGTSGISPEELARLLEQAKAGRDAAAGLRQQMSTTGSKLDKISDDVKAIKGKLETAPTTPPTKPRKP